MGDEELKEKDEINQDPAKGSAVADDLEAEIASLKEENETLKKDIENLKMENQNVKKLNYTLARKTEAKKESLEQAVVDMFGKVRAKRGG